MTIDEDFTKMSDADFLAERRRVREVLEHTPEHSVSLRDEGAFSEARRRVPSASANCVGRWQVNATEAIATLPRDAARMLAVEILLAEPAGLGDDVLESCLYILREKLRAA